MLALRLEGVNVMPLSIPLMVPPEVELGLDPAFKLLLNRPLLVVAVSLDELTSFWSLATSSSSRIVSVEWDSGMSDVGEVTAESGGGGGVVGFDSGVSGTR